MCRDAASFDLKAEDLATCLEEVHRAVEIAALKREQQARHTRNVIQI